MRKARFEPFIGQVFTIRPNEDLLIPVKLTGVVDGPANKQYESFTVNFDPIEDAPALPDGSYWMENEGFGRAIIFISATPAPTPDPRQYYYEAAFNVLIDPEGERG